MGEDWKKQAFNEVGAGLLLVKEFVGGLEYK